MPLGSLINFSAIFITCNESARLAECLSRMRSCGELLVFDMHSTDGSTEIAGSIADRVVTIDQVDVVEKVWPQVIREAKNDWILLIDPDEAFPAAILPELDALIHKQPQVGLISIPWKYYFLGKPLNSTSWGQEHFKARIFHRDRVDLTGVLFKGIQLKPGYASYTFPTETGFILRHYWIDSIPQLFSKHWRYIRNDGEARYNKGERFSIKRQCKDTWRTLRRDLIDYHGIRDGCRGIFLSFFHAWFIFNCHISLFFYQVFKVPKLSDPRAA
jgi:glycosyltransferase involved in cell wall biosynthesis